MTNEEFSNAFDTLLNAYKHKSEFGDQSSLADVTIDEYEKSIFLTQAQDNIVKNYFTKSLSPTGEGFDDSTRRQMDFSTLVTVKSINVTGSKGSGFSTNGYLLSFKDEDFTVGEGDNVKKAYPLFIINEKVTCQGKLVSAATEGVAGVEASYHEFKDSNSGLYLKAKNIYTKPISLTITKGSDIASGTKYTSTVEDGDTVVISIALNTDEYSRTTLASAINADSTLNTYIQAEVSEDYADYVEDESFVLNDGYTQTETLEKSVAAVAATDAVYSGGNNYVIVPINYKDYDRMMSRAYSEPLKRQAWRLFEASSSDLSRQAEVILRTDAGAPTTYTVRYVRRPRPIVLVDLTNTDNQLTIDGEKAVTTCELNPIVHQEILQEAVRLALASNGIETRDTKAARQAANNQ